MRSPISSAPPDRAVSFITTARRSKGGCCFPPPRAPDGAPLAPLDPGVVRARNGLGLVCYLSRPRDAAPGKPLPMVLCVHGGPWSRDFWGFQPTHQWLPDRRYAIG